MRYYMRPVIVQVKEDAEYETSCDRCQERVYGPKPVVSIDNAEIWCMECAEQLYEVILDHYLKQADDQA